MAVAGVKDAKQKMKSEVYLEGLLASRVPAAETVFGALIWLAIVIGVVRDVGSALWMLSALVGLPLALRLAERTTSGPTNASISWLRAFSVPAAIAASLSLLASGPLSFILSLPWLALTFLVATVGIFRFLSRGTFASPMVVMDAGLVLVGVSGVAFTLARMGIGFASPIEFQSIVFLFPVVAAECVRQTKGRWWTAQLMLVAIAVGAIASRSGGTAELVGHVIIALAFAKIGFALLRIGSEQSVVAQIGLLSGGVAIGFGAGLVIAAQGFTFYDLDGEAIDLMRTLDARLIAIGFGGPALLGLNLIPHEIKKGCRRTFFHLGPPTREQLDGLVQELEHQAPKVDANPFAQEAPAGFRIHRSERSVPDFDNSCEAIWTWAGHEAAGIQLTPAQPPILIGEDFVFTTPVGPFTITSTGRVVALISDEDYYGFVYSTLDHHPLVATEAIILDKSSGQSILKISTVWRPDCLAARLIAPIGNRLLGYFVSGYLDGIADAEDAAIGARMMDVLSGTSRQRYEVSRDSIRAESAVSLPSAAEAIEEGESVQTRPTSEFEALFIAPPMDRPDNGETPTEDELP